MGTSQPLLKNPMEQSSESPLYLLNHQDGCYIHTPNPRSFIYKVHLMEENDDMLEQLGLMENAANNDVQAPPPPPPLPPPLPMEQERE